MYVLQPTIARIVSAVRRSLRRSACVRHGLLHGRVRDVRGGEAEQRQRQNKGPCGCNESSRYLEQMMAVDTGQSTAKKLLSWWITTPRSSSSSCCCKCRVLPGAAPSSNSTLLSSSGSSYIVELHKHPSGPVDTSKPQRHAPVLVARDAQVVHARQAPRVRPCIAHEGKSWACGSGAWRGVRILTRRPKGTSSGVTSRSAELT